MDILKKYYPDMKITQRFLGNDGTVYILNDKIAVKILHDNSWATESNDVIITREAMLQQLAYELGVSPEVYLVDLDHGLMSSEYIKGMTIDQYLKKSPQKSSFIRKKIEHILDILYDNGIRHGDLAGSNFIIDTNENIFIIDFSSGTLQKEPIIRDYYITGALEESLEESFGHIKHKHKLMKVKIHQLN